MYLQAVAYGKCIVADYQSVHQDMCAREFMRLKECYLVSFSFRRYFIGHLLSTDTLTESCEEAVAVVHALGPSLEWLSQSSTSLNKKVAF